MGWQDIVDAAITIKDHAEEMLRQEAEKPAVVAEVDHLAAFIADAGLGPTVGSLVTAIVNDVVARADQLEIAHPLGGAGAEPAPPPEQPAELAPAPEQPAVGGTGT
jgi:hypothetical protein